MRELFSKNAESTLIEACKAAKMLQSGYIGSEHLFLGIIEQKESAACMALIRRKVDLSMLEKELLLHSSQKHYSISPDSLFSARLTRIIEISLAIAKNLGKTMMCTEHLLLGALREANGAGAKILADRFGITFKELLKEIYNIDDLKLGNLENVRQEADKIFDYLHEKFNSSGVECDEAGRIEEVAHLLETAEKILEHTELSDLRHECRKLKDKARFYLSCESLIPGKKFTPVEASALSEPKIMNNVLTVKKDDIKEALTEAIREIVAEDPQIIRRLSAIADKINLD